MKRIEKRLTAVALAIIMVINLMPVVVARANDSVYDPVYYVDV